MLLRWLLCLILAAATAHANSIQTEPIPPAKLLLRVFAPAIHAPTDSFQTMHSGFLFVPGEGVYAYGTPLGSAGAGVSEQLSIWKLDDTVDVSSDLILNQDVWHTPGLPGGDTLVNPLVPYTMFDVRSDDLFDWADSCLCAYTSDPFMLLDHDSVKTFLLRATLSCYEKVGRVQNVNMIYAVRWDGAFGLDTATLINGYYNAGSPLVQEHASLNLYAPSVVVEDGFYRIFTIEDTAGGRALTLWESADLSRLSAAPATWTAKRKTLGNLQSTHYNLALVDWQLPENDQHWHTTIHSPSPGLYEGFATGALIDNQPVWFGASTDAEHWTTYPAPIIPAGGARPGTPLIDSTIYTVRPLVVQGNDGPYYRLVVSGARDTADSYDWYSTVVDMLQFGPQAPSAPVAVFPVIDTCPVIDLRPTLVWSTSIDPDPGESATYYLHMDDTPSFTSPWVSPPTADTSLLLPDSLGFNQAVWWKVIAADTTGRTSESAPTSFRTFLPGDVDGSGSLSVADLTQLVAFLFRGGQLPCAFVLADTNGDCGVSVSDLTLLVNFLFRGGLPPEAGCSGRQVIIGRFFTPATDSFLVTAQNTLY